MLLAIDPSSTCTGFAVLTGPEVLVEAGRLTPGRQTAPAIIRIATMREELIHLIIEKTPNQIIIEIPSAHVSGRIRMPKQGKGMGVYGMAAGVLWATAVSLCQTATVDERTWTGCRKKEVRAREIAAIFPAYRKIKDPGLNIADAIGIGRWWFLAKSAQERAR